MLLSTRNALFIFFALCRGIVAKSRSLELGKHCGWVFRVPCAKGRIQDFHVQTIAHAMLKCHHQLLLCRLGLEVNSLLKQSTT